MTASGRAKLAMYELVRASFCLSGFGQMSHREGDTNRSRARSMITIVSVLAALLVLMTLFTIVSAPLWR